MRIQRRGAERNRGSKQAEIQRSDLQMWDFLGHNFIRFQFTPSGGFDPDCTHLYEIDMQIDEFANIIEKLERSARLCSLEEESSTSIKRLAESLGTLAGTLERKG